MATFVPQRTRNAPPGTRAADELLLELGHLLADFSRRVPYLFSDAAARNRVDAGDRACRLGSGADVRIARGRDPHDPTPLARADRERLCRAVPNVPLLVQMFLWYFVLPELVPRGIGTWLKQLPDASFYTAVVALGFYTSARVAEQVRAGLLSLARGQGWAALALGLTPTQAYAYVLLPMAYRIILPPLTSEFLNIIKNSAVALTIGLMELTARAR